MAAQGFVDTLPGDATASPQQSGEGAEGDRQGGRRRRRGGRGRDRDEAGLGSEPGREAQAAQDGEAAPARTESGEGFDGAPIESGEARSEDGAVPGEGREGGARRRRGGRGRDRDRGPREGAAAEGSAAEGTARDLPATPPEVWQTHERAEPHSFADRASFEPAEQEPAPMPLFEQGAEARTVTAPAPAPRAARRAGSGAGRAGGCRGGLRAADRLADRGGRQRRPAVGQLRCREDPRRAGGDRGDAGADPRAARDQEGRAAGRGPAGPGGDAQGPVAGARCRSRTRRRTPERSGLEPAHGPAAARAAPGRSAFQGRRSRARW